MWFTDREKQAIQTVACAMGAADDEADAREVVLITLVNEKLGIPSDISTIDLGSAMNVISAMTAEEKRFVCAYMGTLLSIDGDIDPREMLFWGLLTERCHFPEMTIEAARNYMSNFKG